MYGSAVTFPIRVSINSAICNQSSGFYLYLKLYTKYNMSIPNTASQITLNVAPTKEVNINWGEKDSTFRIDKQTFTEVKNGEFIIKNLYISNDPTQRGWMQKGIDPSRMYAPPILENEPVRCYAIGEVVYSKSEKYNVGDKIIGGSYWGDYALTNEDKVFSKIDESQGLPLPIYISSLGHTGLTAYFGLKEAGQFKKGQTVVVSAASGATGSMVVQLAKHLFGASKVIGITSSEEKGKWVESLGADICFDYTKPDFEEKLSKEIGQDYVDVYFDNVGGSILDFMLPKIKKHGHVVACGAISGYNDREKLKITNWGEIITNSLTVKGFIVTNYMSQFPSAIADLVDGIQKGKIKITEGCSIVDLSKEKTPIEKIPEVWKQLFGTNKPNGKLLTKLV